MRRSKISMGLNRRPNVKKQNGGGAGRRGNANWGVKNEHNAQKKSITKIKNKTTNVRKPTASKSQHEAFSVSPRGAAQARTEQAQLSSSP
jgi:hypothetical protein